MDEKSRDAVERDRLLHELRTPVTVLLGRLQLIHRRARRDGVAPALGAADVVAFEAAVARLRAAVEDVERELERLGDG